MDRQVRFSAEAPSADTRCRKKEAPSKHSIELGHLPTGTERCEGSATAGVGECGDPQRTHEFPGLSAVHRRLSPIPFWASVTTPSGPWRKRPEHRIGGIGTPRLALPPTAYQRSPCKATRLASAMFLIVIGKGIEEAVLRSAAVVHVLACRCVGRPVRRGCANQVGSVASRSVGHSALSLSVPDSEVQNQRQGRRPVCDQAEGNGPSQGKAAGRLHIPQPTRIVGYVFGSSREAQQPQQRHNGFRPVTVRPDV